MMDLGIVQTNTGRNASENIIELEHLLVGLERCDLVVTPECTNVMGFRSGVDRLPVLEDCIVTNYLRDWAEAHETAIVVGSALLKDETTGDAVNRQILIDSSGSIAASYDKIHMFDVDLPNGERFEESKRFHAGNKAVLSAINNVRIGHSICFDLRFPSLYQNLSEAGAEILLVPAAFTALTGRAHWEPLLRARAIENGAYVIAPGQCGAFKHSDDTTRHCWGHSMVISPWGEILCEFGGEPKSARMVIDIASVHEARKRIPSLNARRDFEKLGKSLEK